MFGNPGEKGDDHHWIRLDAYFTSLQIEWIACLPEFL